MNKKPMKKTKGIFTKGMTYRLIYQGIMIGLITLTAFILGLAIEGEPMYKIQVAQTMAFTVLAFSELVHVFNIRNNLKSVFTTNPFNNDKLLLAIFASAVLMFAVLLIPVLRDIFGIVLLPAEKLIETICLVFVPVVIVEIFKLLKINGGE